MAGTKGGNQQTKIRKDWREEANHCNQRPVRRIPRYALALIYIGT